MSHTANCSHQIRRRTRRILAGQSRQLPRAYPIPETSYRQWRLILRYLDGRFRASSLLRYLAFDIRHSRTHSLSLSLSICGGSDLSHLAARSASLGSLKGRTMRKPTFRASVKYQMLCGTCGSCCFQSSDEPTRAALRQRTGLSSHEPPRTTRGYSLSGIASGSLNGSFDSTPAILILA